jgi:hypothetical protein
VQPLVIKVLVKKGAVQSLAEDMYMDGLEALYGEISVREAETLIDKIPEPREAQRQTYLIRICLKLFYQSLPKNKLPSGVTYARDLGYIKDEAMTTNLHYAEQKELPDAKSGMLDGSCQEVPGLFFRQGSMKDIVIKLGTSETLC